MINNILVALHSSSDDILMSLVISSDGLLIAHQGDINDPDLFAAYFLELNVTCDKILKEFDLSGVEEIFLRTPSGCVTVFSIFDKGYLACLSTPSMNSSQLQIRTWAAIKRIYDVLAG